MHLLKDIFVIMACLTFIELKVIFFLFLEKFLKLILTLPKEGY